MPGFDDNESVSHQSASNGGDMWSNPKVKVSSVGDDVGSIPANVPIIDNGQGRRETVEGAKSAYNIPEGASTSEAARRLRQEAVQWYDD
jgi:hypothetical protein